MANYHGAELAQLVAHVAQEIGHFRSGEWDAFDVDEVVFQQAHWGVFSLDLARPARLEQVAQPFFRRDGLVLGDHAGQVVRDGDLIVATSSWGDFDPATGVHVRHLATPGDVLSGVHVLETERTDLPTEVSSWDPGITRTDGRWHVSFVESPSQDPFDFHPTLAAGPAGERAWDARLEPVGAATDLHQCEVPILSRVGEDWWLLASDGDARHYPVYDLSMRRVGRLDAPYESNIPHPQLVPLDDGTCLVTFDGTQYAEPVMGYGGHGDVIVMRTRGLRTPVTRGGADLGPSCRDCLGWHRAASGHGHTLPGRLGAPHPATGRRIPVQTRRDDLARLARPEIIEAFDLKNIQKLRADSTSLKDARQESRSGMRADRRATTRAAERLVIRRGRQPHGPWRSDHTGRRPVQWLHPV